MMMTDEQFQKLPKYVQEHIMDLSRRIERYENLVRENAIVWYDGEPDPPTVSLIGVSPDRKRGIVVEERVDPMSVRFRPDPKQPKVYMDMRVNKTFRGELSVSVMASNIINVQPSSSNSIYLTVPPRPET